MAGKPKLRPVFRAVLALFLLMSPVVAQELLIQLKGVPPRFGFPLSTGTNLVLTADITGGSAREVWLARERDARLRVLLTRVAEGRYQINLADPEVKAALTTREQTGQFQVFARAQDWRLSASIPVQFGPYDPDVVEVMAIVQTRLGDRVMPVDSRQKEWFDPAVVRSVELRFSGYPLAPHASARIGKDSYTLTRREDSLRYSLLATPEFRKHWQENGQLRVIHGRHGAEKMTFTFHAIPDRIALAEEGACLTVAQRLSHRIPGTRNYLRLRLGDVTGGQVLISIVADDGNVLKLVSARPGDRVAFRLGNGSYTLMTVSLANFLIGEDYGVFVVYEKTLPEVVKIKALIATARHSPVLFYAEEERRSGEWMERFLKKTLRGWNARNGNLDSFIERVSRADEAKTLTVRIPGGPKKALDTWLEEQAAVFKAKVTHQRK